MSLEDKNKTYVETKKKMELDLRFLDILRKEYEKLEKEQRKYQRELKRAEKNNDLVAKKAAEKNLKDVAKRIEEKIAEMNIKRNEISQSKKIIDEAIAEIQQHPDMKKAMDDALDERYRRQLEKLEPERDKLNKEKEEKEKNKKGLEVLEQAIKNDQNNKTLLADLLKAKAEMKKINEELATLDYKDPNDQARISEITMKLIPDTQKAIATSKKGLVSNMNKKGIPFTEDRLDSIAQKMIENGLALDKNGNIDVVQSLKDSIDIADKDIKSLSKQIRSYDKQIGNYTMLRTDSQIDHTQPAGQTQKPVSTTKWYQFGRRFAEWREARKQKQLPEPQEQQPETINIKTMFRNELMRDAFREGIGEHGKFDGSYEKAALKRAKAARKQQEKDDASRV